VCSSDLDMNKRQEQVNYLNTFKILTNQEKKFLFKKNKSEIEKYTIRRKRELRFKLRRYIVEKLGLTMDDPEIIKIFEKFDKNPENFIDYSRMDTELKKLKKMRINETISDNRLKLIKSIDSMNLSNIDKKSILAMYDKKPNRVMLYETTAKQIIAVRKKELRNKETKILTTLLKSLKLSETNSKKIMNSFMSIPNSKLAEAKSKAFRLRKKLNSEKLTTVIRPLSLSEKNRKVLLANTNNVNTVIKKAINMSTQKKIKNATQNQLRQYIGSKNLGNKSKNILNNINDTLTTEDVASIRAKVNRLKEETNATKISKKREEIVRYMNKIPLSVTEKQKIIQNVNINTNVNTVKRNIQSTLNKKNNSKNALVKERIELEIYINTLNLPNTDKQRLISSKDTAKSLKRKAYKLSESIRKLNLNRQMNAFKRQKVIMRMRIKAEEDLKSLKRAIKK
jgi:hypothetical protein